ncbi:hypothetical protein [Nitrososphaera sp.]|uniref:hypothetical protein n=1 Tax=Nitrososphaera sp. TaxID=1971748 RepID=UPI00317F174F
MYFVALALLGIFVATCVLVLPAFAEPAQAKPIPVAHTLAIVESVHVVSVMGNAGSMPAVHVRAISDSLSVSAAFPQQTGQNTVYRSHAPSSAGPQRIEERSPLQPVQKRNVQYTDTRAFEGVSATPIVVMVTPDTGPHDGGGEDSPDDPDLQYLFLSEKSIGAASGYSAAAYGAMGVAVIALYSRNSGALGFARESVLAGAGAYVLSRYVALGRGARVAALAGLATVAVVSANSSDLSAFADSPAGMAYRIGTSGGLGYREWDPSTSSWSSEASLTSAGAQIEAVKFLYSPVAGSELRIIGVRETNGEIDIYYCTADCTNPASWTGPTLVADMGTPTGGRKYFDMAFEHASGDLLIVYDKTTAADTNDFFYQVFDADTLTLSGESGFDYISDTTTDNDIRFFKTASKTGSDEIAMVLLDATNSDAVALIWDGSSFGNQLTVTDTVLSASLTGESIGIAYESSSGAALVVAPGLATNEVRYARHTGSWSAVSTLSGGINPDVTGDDPVWMTVKPDPNPSSNKIMVCSTDDVSDFSCVQFDAGVPGTPIRHDAATGGASRRGDFAWVGWDSTGLALWYDNAAASYQHSRWDGSGWGTEVSTAVGQALIWVTAVSDNDSTTSGVDSLWAFYSQAAPDNIGDGEYDSTTFTLNGLGTISASAGTANTDDVVSLDSRKPRSYSRSTSDSVMVSAGITAKITGRAVPDSLPVSDSVARVYNNVEPTSSSIAISDVISTSLFSPGNAYIFENLGIADSVHITVPRSMSDGLSVADTPSKRAAKPVAETLALASDVDTRVAKNIPESLSVADTPARMLSAPRSVPVTITFTDSIPSDSNAAGMAYRSATGSGANFPKYREWNPQTFAWSQEVELPSAGSPVRFAWIEFSPVSAKRVIVTLSDDGFLDSYACDNQCTQAGSWTVQNNVVEVRSALTGIERPFDIEFERTSGDLMLVYDRVSTDSSQDLFYRIMPDSSNTFGSEFSINDTSETATDISYSFIRMDSRRTSGSDAIGMIALDATNSDAVAFVWDGGAWGNESELTGTVSATSTEVIDVAYESNSGNLVAVAGEGTDIRYNRFTTSWQTSSTGAGTWAVGTVNWLNLTPNPASSSNEVFLAATGSASDLDSAYWDGSSWTDHAEHDAGLGGTAGRGFDFAWTGDSNAGVLIWRTQIDFLDFKRFTAPDTFSTQGAFAESANHNWVQLVTNPTSADYVAALGATIDVSNDIGGIRWDGGAADPTSTGDNGITLSGLDTYESMQVNFQKSKAVKRFVSDSVTATDSASRLYHAYRLPPDTVQLGDSITMHVTRSVQASIGISDSIARGASRSTADPVSISDSISIDVFSPTNPRLFQTLAITDKIVVSIPRQLEDSLSVSALVSKAVSKNLPVELSVTDSLPLTVPVSIDDGIAVSDSPARKLVAPRQLADSVGVSDDAHLDENVAAIAYRSATGSGTSFPKYREWDPAGQAWTAEVELPSAGSPVRYAWLEFSPVSTKRVIVTLSDDGFLDSYACSDACTDPDSWTVQNNIVDLWTTAPGGVQRPFDIEFERTSGDLMLVYDRVSTDSSQDLFYRIMADSSTTFGTESTIDDTTASDTDVVYSFVQMDSRRTSGSDAIGMIALDATNSDAVAWIWDGGAWGNESELTGTVSVTNRQAVDIAYESNSGNLVVAAGEGTAVRYNRFTTSWQTSSTSTGTWDTGTINWVKLVPNPASNEIFMGAVGSSNDLDSAYWDGSSWTDHAEHDAGLGSIAGPSFDFAWDGAGSGIIIWGTTAGQLDFKRLTSPDVFSSQDSFADTGSHNWIQLAANPLSSDSVAVLGATIDNANDISGLRWNGSASSPTSTGDNAITISSLDTYESARVDFQKAQRIGKTVFDSVGLSDSVSRLIVVNRTINESLALAVQATTHAPTPVADGFVIDDKINYRVTRFIAVALDVEDAIVAEPSSGVLDTVGLQDGISIAVTKLIGDSLGSSDALALKPSNIRLDDGVAIADAVNTGIPVLLSDGIGVSDVLVGARSVDISDSIGVAAALTDVSWSRTLALADGLGLASDSCTPAECLLNLVLGESLALQDEWLPPPGAQDTIAVVDSVAANALYHTQVAESLSASDRPETALAVAPPDIPASWDLTEMPRAMIVTEPGLVEPPEAQELPGTYSASGGIASLLQQTDMPVYNTSQMTSATDMTGKTIVLPLFQVSMTPTDDMPGRNAILTPIIDSLPADVKLSLPVDIGSTLSEEAEAHPVSWMNLDFAPDSSGSNFALMLSMLDTKPAAAQDVKAQVSAFFIDLDWTGSFAGSATPADSGFYSKPPDLTFAITDAWATGQDLARDQNGVPVMEMFLLNDATGEWERVPGIDSPAGAVDGSYTYVAHLQHFSTYVATSAKAPSGFSQGAPREPVSSFTALLSDTVSVTDSQEGRALELIEEFAGKKTAVTVLELLNVASKPIAFGKTLQAGTNVSVGIALDDVSTSSIIPPEVKATLVLDVKNAGGSMERFLLNIRYFDQSGKVAYDTSQRIEIGPYESSQMIVQVPFTTSGDFVISLDARSEAENRILGTAQIEVAVPWLAVNMHLIIATAAATFAGAGTMLAYILRRQKTGEDAQVI